MDNTQQKPSIRQKAYNSVGYGYKEGKLIQAIRRRGEMASHALKRVGKRHGIVMKPWPKSDAMDSVHSGLSAIARASSEGSLGFDTDDEVR